jgi:hypothetical protein
MIEEAQIGRALEQSSSPAQTFMAMQTPWLLLRLVR